MCVVASRTLVALLVPILRSRRGRDFTILAVTLLGLMPPLLEMFAARGPQGQDIQASTVQLADRVRLTPFAWGGTAVADASRGHDLAAIGLLAAIGADDRGAAVRLVARARARAHELRRARSGAARVDASAGSRV